MIDEGGKARYHEIAKAIQRLSDAINDLAEYRVIRSRKVVSDFGEWLVVQMYDGVLASSKNKEYWDVEVGSEKIQVKTTSKAEDNHNRWLEIKNPNRFDTLMVIVLTTQFKVREFYRISSQELHPYLTPYGDNYKVKWDDIKEWMISKERVPNCDKLAVFFA